MSTRQSSGKGTWQAAEDGSQDSLVGTRRRQMQFDMTAQGFGGGCAEDEAETVRPAEVDGLGDQ